MLCEVYFIWKLIQKSDMFGKRLLLWMCIENEIPFLYRNEKTLVLTETTKDLLRAPNSVYILSMEWISFGWNKTIKVLHLLRINGQFFFVTKKPDFHINSLKCCCIAYGVIFFTVELFSLRFCLESHIAQSSSKITLKSEKRSVFSLKCFEIYM